MDNNFIQVKTSGDPPPEIMCKMSRTGGEIKYISAETNVFWDVKSKVKQLVWDTVYGILQIFTISRAELSHILIDVAEELLVEEK